MTIEFSQLICSEAFAHDEIVNTETSKASSFTSFIPLILITAVFYFLVIRPQQKKNKEHQTKLKTLSRGDEIITTGGIIATVSNVPQDADYILVEIAKDVKVKLSKLYVADFASKDNSRDKSQEKKSSKKQEDKSDEK